MHHSPQKAPHHQSGTLHATTHRLFYIDNAHSFSRSFSLDLAHVGRTEYYAGLFTSSAKITLYLNDPPPRPLTSIVADRAESSLDSPAASYQVEFWECEVCSNRNPIGLTSSAAFVCALCGVPRASMKAPITIPSRQTAAGSYSLSKSLPSSSVNLAKLRLSSSPSPSPPVPEVPAPPATGEVACIACTFLNSPLLQECEICGTPLPRKPSLAPPPRLPAKSAPASRSATPALDSDDDDDDNPDKRMIRLSFRKGGDKAFYNVLRRTLLGRAWEVRPATYCDCAAADLCTQSKAVAAAVEAPSSSSSSSRPLGRSGISACPNCSIIVAQADSYRLVRRHPAFSGDHRSDSSI